MVYLVFFRNAISVYALGSGAGERQERVARDPRMDAARRIKYMDNRRAATMRDLTRQGCLVFCCREEWVAMLRIKSVQESDL
jgi:hypothetical protein